MCGGFHIKVSELLAESITAVTFTTAKRSDGQENVKY